MRRAIGAVLALAASAAWAQDYTPGENPFQGEYAFLAGQALNLRVEISGLRLDSLLLAAVRTDAEGGQATCRVTVAGSHAGSGKATVTAVLLLEDADGRSLERVTLDPFKAKSGKPFERVQEVTVESVTLAALARVFLFVKVDL